MDLPVPIGVLHKTLRSHGVAFALVFGSYADGRADPASDLDLAAWSPRALDDWRLLGDLPDLVDLVDLRSAPDALAGRIALTGIVILDDDPPLRIRWQATTRKRHLDESFRRDRFRRVFMAAHG